MELQRYYAIVGRQNIDDNEHILKHSELIFTTIYTLTY